MPPEAIPPAPVQPTPTGSPGYGFLDQPAKTSSRPKIVGSSLKSRVLVSLVGLLALVVLFVVVKGLLTTSPYNKNDYAEVLYVQEAMLHILTTDVTPSNQNQLSAADQNFVGTATLSITTSQSQMLTYLKDRGLKISSSALAKHFNASIDTELSSSLTANDFNSTFSTAMNQQLTLYQKDLNTAYNATTGANGRAMLKADYSDAKTLLRALNSPAS